MPKIISDSTESQVIICRLEGRPRKETAQITGISETKIQQIWNDFRENIGEAKFEALSKIGEFLLSKGLSFAQLTDEFCIRSRLDKLGVKIDTNLDSFVDDVYLVCKEHKINPTTIVKEIINLRNISAQSKISIGKLSQYFYEIKSKTEQLQQENQQLLQDTTQKRKDAVIAKKEKLDALTQKKVTIQELKEYVTAKKDFEEFGVSIKDLPKATKVLISLKRYGWDDYQILKHLNEKSSYTKQIAQLESKKDSLHAEISIYQQTKDRQTKEIKLNATTIANQISKIKELKKQEAQILQALDIRKDLYEIKIRQFDLYAEESLTKIQEKGTNAIEQTAKKVTEDQEKFFKDQKNAFAAITNEVSAAVENIALTVQRVASLKIVQPLYKLLSFQVTPFEAIQGIMLPLGSFLIQYANDPNHNPGTLSNGKSFERSLQGDLKRRF